MSLALRLLLALVALGTLGSPAAAVDREDFVDRLKVFCTWDRTYLYLGVKMEDINVVGRHDGLNEAIDEDDNVSFYFQVDGQRVDELTDASVRLAISAAQGVTFERAGLPASPLRPGQGRLQVKTAVMGTLNDTADVDQGWQVELAVPWHVLGVEAPANGQTWGFNVTRTLRGESDARYSYMADAEVTRPASWAAIIFRDQAGPDGAGAGWIEAGEARALIAPKTATPPRVDGEVAAAEYPALFALEATLDPRWLRNLESLPVAPPPDVTEPRVDEHDFRPRAVNARAPRDAYAGERLLWATYHLHYQADASQPDFPAAGVHGRDGASRLSVQPLGGTGPWFSGLRASWHREQLRQAAAAGVDALLVSWPLPHHPAALAELRPEQQRRLLTASLRSLVVAANDLDRFGYDHPALALALPLEALEQAADGQLDLTYQPTQAALYGLIREFYSLVPAHLRLQVADGRRQAVPVGLGAPTRDLRASESFMAYCEQRMLEDLGLDLVWLGPPTWSRRRVGMDAYVDWEAGRGWFANDVGRVRAGSVGPGYDNTGVDPAPTVRSRKLAGTLRDDFRLALGALGPDTPLDWLVLTSWNDYTHGDNIAPSEAYGDTHARSLGVLAMPFNSPREQPWVAKIRRAEVPLRVPAGEAVTAPVRVINGGVRPWTVDDDVRLGYRWYPAQAEIVKDAAGMPLLDRQGRPVRRDRPLTEQGLRSAVMVAPPSATADVLLPVAAVDDAGKPLAPGTYRLRLDAVAGVSEADVEVLDAEGKPVLNEDGTPQTRRVSTPNWLSLRGDPAFDLVVEVVPPGERVPAASVFSAGLPTRVENGRVYPLAVQVRNDGPEAWGDGVRVGARYERVELPAFGRAEPALVGLTDWLPLAPTASEGDQKVPGVAGLEPGAVVAAEVELPVADAAGKALPEPRGARQWVQVRLAVLDESGKPLPTVRPYVQALELLKRDHGAAFGPIKAPSVMRAGAVAPVEVAVTNTAFATWPAERTALTYSWYAWDGTELAADVQRLRLPEDVPSGKRLTVSVPVQAPAVLGPYRLLFDVVHEGEVFGRQTPATTGLDLLPVSVQVVGGAMRPVELSGVANLVAQSYDTDRAAADFDGQGRSLPAEQLPPFNDGVVGGAYPSGLFGPVDSVTAPGQRRVPFQYLAPSEGKRTAVRAEGQRILVTPGRYQRVHLLAASVGEPLDATFGLQTDAGRVESPSVSFEPWDRAPQSRPLLGFMLGHRHTPEGDDLQHRAYLGHAVLALDPARTLSALVLPDAPDLRILAITLEAADVREELGPPAAGG